MRKIKNGDAVFATGVFLIRDTNTNGEWIVGSFEDDTYYDGEVMETRYINGEFEGYYTGLEEEE